MKIYVDFEVWRNITYPGVKTDMYQISNFGNVINIKRNKQLKSHKDKDGYLRVWLVGSEGHIVVHAHRLVAWEFVEYNRDIQLCVNHKDCVRSNNYYKNLEWVTYQENSDYLRKYGDFKLGESVYNCKYSDELVNNIIVLLDGRYTISEVTYLIMERFEINDFKNLRKFVYRIIHRETREELTNGKDIKYRKERISKK